MAQGPGSGHWLVVQELLERGDSAFVDEIRMVSDGDVLGAFAGRWYTDRRSASRRLLLEYLDRPLNAYRHEALVKRLFKLAEAAGDDEVMARFLVLFDRSIRRIRARRRHSERREVKGRDQALTLAADWRDRGFQQVTSWDSGRGVFYVWGSWTEHVIRLPRFTAMPRGKPVEQYDYWAGGRRTRPDWVYRLNLDPKAYRDETQLTDAVRDKLGRYRLFSVHTRHYLRRRAWRYFRRLGKQSPERYVAAVSEALLRYEDADVADGLALLDNWGLVHILFHGSATIVAKPTGWLPAEGRAVGELQVAPIFEPLWAAAPRSLFRLLLDGRCRAVRRWASVMMRRYAPAVAPAVALEDWLALLSHEDAEVVSLASDALRELPGLGELAPERWLTLLATVNPDALELIAELMDQHVRPDRLDFATIVRLAASRPLPVARLGLGWLRPRTPANSDECRLLLGLVEAEAEPLRGEIVAWARGALAGSPEFRPEWVLEYLDSRHADVRAEGWRWFLEDSRTRDVVELWHRLLESPYDDLQIALVAELERREAARGDGTTVRVGLDPELLRSLWASVLLNVRRGSRAKPKVVDQLVRRIEARPKDAPSLLPLLAVALRSTRGPEWRAGLSAVVRLAGRGPEAATLVRATFPELQWA